MSTYRVDVLATTISGSVSDQRKIGRIAPLFASRGWADVHVHVLDSHAAVRRVARDLVREGRRVLISAGGSGTFNRVLEGCMDAAAPIAEVRLGFLRKGSADLIGKTLGMPDEIEPAIAVFADALGQDRTVPCDVLEVTTDDPAEPPRHFAGYGGAGIFGRIPYFTENRFIKLYKGILGQLFGDMGPFFVGVTVASFEDVGRGLWGARRHWRLEVDGAPSTSGAYRAMILSNGDLGPDLPFARGEPLGSGEFHLIAFRDVGLARLPGQFRRAWSGAAADDPARWGFEHHRIRSTLRIVSERGGPFPVNVDGSTMWARTSATVRIVGQVPLLCAPERLTTHAPRPHP